MASKKKKSHRWPLFQSFSEFSPNMGKVRFVGAKNREEEAELLHDVMALPDGTAFPVRGRDVKENKTNKERIYEKDDFTEWVLGFAVKFTQKKKREEEEDDKGKEKEGEEEREEREKSEAMLLFLWDGGEVERFPVHSLDFVYLIHFVEYLHLGGTDYVIQEQLMTTTSPFQSIQVKDLDLYGRALFLDDELQSATSDEKIYHESLVLPSLVFHPCPKSVFIAGGGEGGTAREVLRCKSIEKCMMVDIDGEVVAACRSFLPYNPCWTDSRLELIIDDAEKAIRSTPLTFDVIIMDLSDPTPHGPCWHLYTIEFFNFLKTKLNPGGILVSQCGPAVRPFRDSVFFPIQNTIRKVFSNVKCYTCHIPSFQDPYSFTIASDTNPLSLSPSKISEKCIQIFTGENEHYDGECHTHLFSLPKAVRMGIEKEEGVVSLGDPSFMPA